MRCRRVAASASTCIEVERLGKQQSGLGLVGGRGLENEQVIQPADGGVVALLANVTLGLGDLFGKSRGRIGVEQQVRRQREQR